MKYKLYPCIIVAFIILLFFGCNNKEFKDLPDENPSEITDISLTIILCDKYIERDKDQFSEICLPFRSQSCPTIAFVNKTVKIVRLDSDEKKDVEVNTWGASGLFKIVESIQGATFEGIAQDVVDNFNNFNADNYLLSESSKKNSLDNIISYANNNKQAKVYFYLDPDKNNTENIKLPGMSYSSIEELRTNIADNLCNNKGKSIPIIIFFKPNFSKDAISQNYITTIDSIKTTIKSLPIDDVVFTKNKMDELISKSDELIKIADSYIEIIEKNERDKQKKYLDDGIVKLTKKINELKIAIKNGGTHQQIPHNLTGTETSTRISTGTLNFPNHDRYVGEIKDGIMHGFGAYYFSSRQVISNYRQKIVADAGYVLKGNWYEGKFSNGKLYDKNDNFIETIIIGQ